MALLAREDERAGEYAEGLHPGVVLLVAETLRLVRDLPDVLTALGVAIVFLPGLVSLQLEVEACTRASVRYVGINSTGAHFAGPWSARRQR